MAVMANRPLLEIDNLSTHYISQQGTRVVRAVDDVSLRINAGETLGIVGESGSGKSTLALTILRVLPPAAQIVAGSMMFENEDLVRKSDNEMRHVRGKRIAMILQDPMASLNPLFTIGDQVAEPIRVHEGSRRAVAWQRAKDLLKAVRIPSPETRVTQHPHEMSGGMRQRIVAARPAARAWAGADLHHPQPRHRGQDVRPARGDVRRPCGGIRTGLAHLQCPGASLYRGSAELDSADERQPQATDRDRGPATGSVGTAARLCLCTALPGRIRSLSQGDTAGVQPG